MIFLRGGRVFTEKLILALLKRRNVQLWMWTKERPNGKNFMVIILSIFLLYKCNKVHK